MGRKMKGTKSGKFINPTDQARKEARKRELRKNKKQRLLVRTAVLKGKDPYQIIADLERLDKMEFDFSQSSALNEKVLKDKRRKLKETWDRLCRLYVKDDKERYQELKRLEADYEGKRNELVKEFEAVKSAQDVSLEDIPLPTLPMENMNAPSSEPASSSSATSILKQGGQQRKKTPPGCPQGLPPLLREFEAVDGDESEEDEEESSDIPKKRIRFADEDTSKPDKESNLKEFLKEIEQLAGDKDEQQPDKDLESDQTDKEPVKVLPSAPLAAASGPLPLVGSGVPGLFPPGSRPPLQPAPPVSMMVPPLNLPPMPPTTIRPPTLPPSFGPPPRLPMPPPPPLSSGRGPMPPMVPSSGPNANTRGNQPSHHNTPMHMLPQPPPPTANPMFSSSSFSNYQRKPGERKSQVTTISAKPQLRNLSADSTKFMPLSLRLNRQATTQKKSAPPKPIVGYGMVSHSSTTASRSSLSASSNSKEQTNSKDDAYADFMKEMSGFI